MLFDSTYNPFSLVGKTILITGASSGIGRATAIECSKMGARCILTARNEERLQETMSNLAGEGHQYIMADLASNEGIELLVNTVPTLEGVALCAGISHSVPILYSKQEMFDKVFRINFFSPVETLRLLIRKKKLTSPSSVVFVDSIGGTRRWSPGNGIYGASKAALQSAMQFFAVECGHKKIRINTINPGMVDTPLIHKGTLSEEQLQLDQKNYPLGRYGEPRDVALGIVYMLSDAASWMTGQALVLDGGVTAK